jgi:hypothetical protein
MILLIFSIAVAQENFPVVIKFDGAIDGGGTKDIHPSTYTGPVTFPHGKHVNEYGASCPDCHHHNDAMSLMGSGSTEGLRCANCHVKEGLIRGPIAENAATRDDLMAHRPNALHLLCRGCHKKRNAEKHLVRAPEACRICHTKRPQDWSLK